MPSLPSKTKIAVKPTPKPKGKAPPSKPVPAIPVKPPMAEGRPISLGIQLVGARHFYQTHAVEVDTMPDAGPETRDFQTAYQRVLTALKESEDALVALGEKHFPGMAWPATVAPWNTDVKRIIYNG